MEQFAESSGIKAALDVPKTVGRLPRNLEIAAFRIVEESLKNVLRHSRSSSVAVRMTRSRGELLLEVQDEGIGIPAQRDTPGLGIVGMRERATELGGSLTVNSGGHGTLVSARFPLGTAEPLEPLEPLVECALSPCFATDSRFRD